MKEEQGVSRVIMGGCRHSFPLVEEQRICGRGGGGEGRCHRAGNGLDGLFGAENRGRVLKIEVRVCLCVGCVYVCVQLCTGHRPQTAGKKIPQHRHHSTGLLWKPQMMSSKCSYLRVSWYCSGEITCFC